jgi:hypothetical protein
MYTFNLIPSLLPQWVEYQGAWHQSDSLTPAQLASIGWLPLIQDTDDAPFRYADPVQETREGVPVAVQYANGTEAERAAFHLHEQWAATAAIQAQLDITAARSILDVPLPDTPTRDDIQVRIDALAILQTAPTQPQVF